MLQIQLLHPVGKIFGAAMSAIGTKEAVATFLLPADG